MAAGYIVQPVVYCLFWQPEKPARRPQKTVMLVCTVLFCIVYCTLVSFKQNCLLE